MNIKNNGITEQEKLQNRFTAFITTTIKHARIDYLRKEKSRAKNQFSMEYEDFALIPDDSDFIADFCESDSLAYALKQISERERYVLFARVIDGKSFEEIADKLGLKYKGVAAIYYRTTVKLKNLLMGD